MSFDLDSEQLQKIMKDIQKKAESDSSVSTEEIIRVLVCELKKAATA